MPQFARPSTDTTREGWEEDDGTIVSIFDQINEVVRDDATFIRSALAPTADAYVTKLTTLEDPLSSSGHIIRYVYGKSAAGGAQIDLNPVEIREGYVSEASLGTLIKLLGAHVNISEVLTLVTITLSGAEADIITNYGDLWLRWVANQV